MPLELHEGPAEAAARSSDVRPPGSQARPPWWGPDTCTEDPAAWVCRLTCSWRLRARCFTAVAWRARPRWTWSSRRLHALHHTLPESKSKTGPVRARSAGRAGQWGPGLRPPAQVPLPRSDTIRSAARNNQGMVLELPAKGWKLMVPKVRPPGGGHGNYSSILAWRIPWTEKPGGLQSVGSHRVRHNQGNLAQKVRPSLRQFRYALFGQCGLKKKKITAKYFRRFHRINYNTTSIYL